MAERTALFIDPTTLNVGIGTDKPIKPFHIEGDMLLSGQIYDSTGFPFSLGGGSWRPLSSNQPIVIPPAGGAFTTTCNITLQRYSANDMALSVAIAGTITSKPPSGDYRLSLPVQLNGPSYPLSTTLGEFWMTASNLSSAQTTLYKAVAKTIPSITDRVAIKYLSGTTEVALSEINAGFHLSLQGMLAYQTDRYVQTAPDESITIPGTNIQWLTATYPNPALAPPVGATVTQTGRQGLLRYLGDDLIYNVLTEATIAAQPTNTALDYKLSLEYPIALSSYSSNAILGDLWLTVTNPAATPPAATTYKAYARSIPSDASNVTLRYLNGTYDLSLADIEPGVSIRVQGNLAYKTTQVASVAIPKEYLPNRLYQDNDGNVAINNAGLPTRARFEIIETSNYPALMVDQRSGSDIAQFRSNVNDIKAIINARGNLGIGTSIAPLPLTVKGNMQFDGTMYDATGSALWIPGSAVNWQATPSPPAITVPAGGAFTTSASAGLWRYIGNEINYNATLQGTLTTVPTDTTQNFAISLPYPVKLSAYATNAIIGDMWADVYYQSSSNTFKAYARVDPTDANRATLRVLAGTKDDTFSTMLATSTLALKGQINYTTTAIIQTIQVPAAQIPVDFRQDQTGQLALNSGGNPPRARLDITTTSNLPALVVDQKGTGNIIDLLGNGNPKVIIDANGNVGIGTTQPNGALNVNGQINAGSGFLPSISGNRSINLVGTDAVMSIIRYSTGGHPAIELRKYDVTGTTQESWWDMYATETDELKLRRRTGGTPGDVMIMNSAGNVGIGTALPLEKLHVNGNMYCNGSIISTNMGLYRNRVINGDMRINQRGFTSASPNTTGNTYSVDRWAVYAGGLPTSFSAGQYDLLSTTDANVYNQGFRKACQVNRGVGGTSIHFRQYIELSMIEDLFNTEISLSFWARASSAGTLIILFGKMSAGTTATTTYRSTMNSSLTTSWQYFNFQMPVFSPTSSSGAQNTFGADLVFDLVNLPSSTSLFITGVQVEKGNISTPFEFRPYAVELQLCQRYFEKSYDIDTKPGTITGVGNLHQRIVVTGSYTYVFPQVFYKVTKRGTTSITIYNPANGNTGVWRNDRVGNESVTSNDGANNISSFFVYNGASHNIGDGIFFQWTSESELFA